VRDSLRRGDIRAATRQARVFSLIPVAVWNETAANDASEFPARKIAESQDWR
jgi:hypothetical protein